VIASYGFNTLEQLSRPQVSDLGRRLREIRARIVASGTSLLTWDEIEREVRSRRGGLQVVENDADVR
jgi:hypothetical protein